MKYFIKILKASRDQSSVTYFTKPINVIWRLSLLVR